MKRGIESRQESVFLVERLCQLDDGVHLDRKNGLDHNRPVWFNSTPAYAGRQRERFNNRGIDLKEILLIAGVLIATHALGLRADAGTVSFGLSGAGVSGSGTLTFGTDPVQGDPSGAYAITNITGTFSDATSNITNEAIT